mmetsp:Transcript_12370/g.30363  ORF Transcript_12370/g.30363 Transcript_12370/m.30363 type:complete len:244 (+) Transcript_12370:737-1468(+)
MLRHQARLASRPAAQVHNRAPAISRCSCQRAVQTPPAAAGSAAAAAAGANQILHPALAPHADQYRLTAALAAAARGKHHMLCTVQGRGEGVRGHGAVARAGHGAAACWRDQLVVAQAVAHEVSDRDALQVVLLGVLEQVGRARHGAVRLVHNLAQHARGVRARQARQVHTGLRVAWAHQHAARAVAQREDVAGPPEVGGLGLGVGQVADGLGAVRRRDASGDALPQVHRDGERGVHGLLVLQA